MTTFRTAEDFGHAIASALAEARRRLLEQRIAAGHWEGRLSSSALSTATASFALALYAQRPVGAAPQIAALAAAGRAWLVSHQNDDGGWGDTVDSPSNISTTALVWACLAGVDNAAACSAAARAEQWLTRAAGSLQPAALAQAIARRYGDDRTFSAPILTMCALAGRLGRPPDAWAVVSQLPFELAALPQALFRFLRLPVVSYALPALIAIGHVRYAQRPSGCPISRLIRAAARPRTLGVLGRIQPESGGFLEATPLTAFVAMSLIGSGLADHPVVNSCIRFLCRSARDDGSWPIDTNLATWVTTLSINALAAAGPVSAFLPDEQIRAIRDWLLAQQHVVRHPYTGAAPGGWAWTDLPGGVPDADDTAGALLALRNLGPPDRAATAAAHAAVRWLLELQNSDGGIPTFCRGWGRLPFDRSAPDLTAHALLAWEAWRELLPTSTADRIAAASARAVAYLIDHQRADGSWLPLWFGNQAAPDQANPTYGTSRVLLALARCPASAAGVAPEAAAARARRWLREAQNSDGGWGAAPAVPSSVEETSQAVQAMLRGGADSEQTQTLQAAGRGLRWLIQATDGGRAFEPRPIGLYFAALWYSEKLYPIIGAVGALGAASTMPPHRLLSEPNFSAAP